jgi:carbonic anhydrase
MPCGRPSRPRPSPTAPRPTPAKAPTPEPSGAGRPAHAAATDPLETLKRRLGEKLGAQTGEQGEVVRISTRPTAAAAAHGSAAGKAAGKAAKGGHAAAAHAPHWSYDGTGGPDEWGKLKAEFIACRGQAAEPDRHPRGIKVELDPVQFDYRRTTFNVIDNGHTVQVNVGTGNSIEVGGPALRAGAVPLPPPVGRAHQRPPVRHGRAPGAQGPRRPPGRGGLLLERGAAQPVLQSRVEQPAAGKGRGNAPRARST